MIVVRCAYVLTQSRLVRLIIQGKLLSRAQQRSSLFKLIEAVQLRQSSNDLMTEYHACTDRELEFSKKVILTKTRL